MSRWNLESTGLLSSYTLSTPDEFYTTVSENEVILFTDKNAKRRKINEITIITNGGTTLKIELLKTDANDNIIEENSSDIIPIFSGSILGNSNTSWDGIRVNGLAGQKILFICSWY